MDYKTNILDYRVFLFFRHLKDFYFQWQKGCFAKQLFTLFLESSFDFFQMKYLDLLWASEWLRQYYPKYDSSELMILLDDIIKWFQDELPEDSSRLIYLKSLHNSPTEALRSIWKEIQLLMGAYWGN
jgi:hypothetical protein